jgi:hypothetical protein
MAETSKKPNESEPTIEVTASRRKAAQNGTDAPQPGAPRAAYTPNYTRPTRRPADERENAFDLLAWMLEGATGIVDELRHNDLGLSEEFWIHAAAARRESLLAMHAALESIIEKTNAADKAQQERAERRERRGGITIE